MTLILIILIINFLIVKLLINLTFKLSKLYVENSHILATTTRRELYQFYVRIYENPKCLDNVLLLHIPIYNLFSCHIVYMAIINAKIKLNK